MRYWRVCPFLSFFLTTFVFFGTNIYLLMKAKCVYMINIKKKLFMTLNYVSLFCGGKEGGGE